MDSVFRAACRTQVTKLCNSIAEYVKPLEAIGFSNVSEPHTVEADIVLFLQRLKNAHSNLRKADEAVRNQVKAEDMAKECEGVLEYDDKAITAIAQLEYILEVKLKPRPQGSNDNNMGHSSTSDNKVYSGVKLKAFELKKFDGNFENWLPFWEQFKQAVHENGSLSNAAKFNFLSSALVGKAAASIAGFTPSEACYKQAIALLEEEYGNNDKIIEKYLQKLLNLKPVQSAHDVKGLRHLYNEITATMRSLTALQVAPDKYDLICKSVLLKVIPATLRVEYHRSLAKESLSSTLLDLGSDEHGEGHLKGLLGFIKVELEAMEKSQLSERDKLPEERVQKRPTIGSATSLYAAAQGELQCIFCKNNSHSTKNCSSHISLEKKKAVLRQEGRYFRCAKRNHNSKFCKAQWLKCERCSGRHITTMCERPCSQLSGSSEATSHSKKQSERREQATTAQESVNLNTLNDGQTEIYLQTAKAVVSNVSSGDRVLSRLIMDNGSQRTYISEKLAKELEIKSGGSEKINIVVFGQKKKIKQAGDYRCVELTLKSQYSKKYVNIVAIVVPTICADFLPLPNVNNPKFAHIQRTLAENEFSDERLLRGINILIGQDYFWQFNTNETEILSENLVAVNTFFGWTVQGRGYEKERAKMQCILNVIEIPGDCCDVSKFWNLESVGILTCQENNEREIIERTIADISWKNDRYVVNLPWKVSRENLKDNKRIAAARLKSLTMKLFRNNAEMAGYDGGVRELLKSGIAEVAPPSSNNKYFMPLMPVYREDSETTKLRIVFDASSSDQGVMSLNDHLSVGDNMIAELLRILVRFRTNNVALVADIEKAFLQIGLAEEDRDCHRFLWYETLPDPNTRLPKVVEYRMTRVTFGVASSPFLLGATINKHLDAYKNQYADTVGTLLKSFYVDDLIMSLASRQAAIETFTQAKKIMSAGNFNLRKWNTNDVQLKELFPVFKSVDSQKVLGINWCTISDEISVDVAGVVKYLQSLRGTKRDVMKAMAKIYDPLGMIGPFTVRQKILLQSVWIKNIEWDQLLSDDLLNEFQTWQEELPQLSDFSIKRALGPCPEARSELHIFADASPKAYGAVAYIRQISSDGSIFTNFICSKNRVSPLQKKTSGNELTLPKLELTAALMAARLKQFLTEAIDVNIEEVYLWSDSTVTLNWINGQGKKLQPYVKARVSEINTLTNIYQWRHCEGRTNPADLLTRGLKAAVLSKTEIWKYGPSWLADAQPHWQAYFTGITSSSVKPQINFNEYEPPVQASFMNIENFSSIPRLLRVTAFVLRFTAGLRSKTRPSAKTIKTIADVHELTYNELQAAETLWVKQTQSTYYNDEIEALAEKKKLPTNSKIGPLNPILTDGILRLQGRLPAAYFGETYNPAILPKRFHLSQLVVMEAHQTTLHSGVNAVLSRIRKKYWIVQGRQLIKQIIQRCVTCKRLHGKAASEPWTVLPVERVMASKPFQTSGVDFAGPLFVKTDDGLSQRKVYILLFTCAAVRAVHLELVGDMTVSSCIQAIKRFVARRGVPSTIISDNARTFKRADLEFRKLETLLKSSAVQQLAATRGIVWKYIPERAAWWGGFWERMVRSVKNALKAALGKNQVTFEELTTFLAEVESVVNARPLTYITGDHNDLEPLTPAHFLTNHNTILFQSNFSSDGSALAKSWEMRQSLIKRYFKRWRDEYLSQLRSIHYNKQQPSSSVKVGDVVLLHEDNKPRLLWRLAVVQITYQGRDGRVRACDVRLANGQVLKRPIQLIYPLEVASSIAGAEDVKNN